MQSKFYSVEVGGKTLTAEFNDWVDLANGSVLVRLGNSAVLATVGMGKESDKDYFPLSVEYEEKFYAAGAILGSRFMRREGRPSDEAVLSGRIVDRTIRPLFPKRKKRDVRGGGAGRARGGGGPGGRAGGAAARAGAAAGGPF